MWLNHKKRDWSKNKLTESGAQTGIAKLKMSREGREGVEKSKKMV